MGLLEKVVGDMLPQQVLATSDVVGKDMLENRGVLTDIVCQTFILWALDEPDKLVLGVHAFIEPYQG